MKRPSEKRLRAWLAEWQKALRLQDWDVQIAMDREKAMECRDCHGVCSYSPNLKRARITIRHPIDFEDANGFPEDVEATIVHELLHLTFSPFYINKGLVNVFQEQAIEVLACSLVALKRKGAAMAKKKEKAAGSPPPAKPAPAKAPMAKVKGGGKSKKGC